jgi:hypothetical protein
MVRLVVTTCKEFTITTAVPNHINPTDMVVVPSSGIAFAQDWECFTDDYAFTVSNFKDFLKTWNISEPVASISVYREGRGWVTKASGEF